MWQRKSDPKAFPVRSAIVPEWRHLTGLLIARLLRARNVRAARIDKAGVPPQSRARQSLSFLLATRRCKRMERCWPDDFRVISISHYYAAAIWLIVRPIERAAIEIRRESPIEPVTEIEVIGPLSITQQIPAGNFDFDDDNLPLGIDTHQVGTSAVTQWHFSKAPNVVACKKPHNAARHIGGADLVCSYGLRIIGVERCT